MAEVGSVMDVTCFQGCKAIYIAGVVGSDSCLALATNAPGLREYGDACFSPRGCSAIFLKG